MYCSKNGQKVGRMSEKLLEFIRSEDALFHYTTAKVVKNILPTMRLKLSQLKDTNDPWEYKFRLLSLVGWSLPPEAMKLFREAHPVVDRIIRNELRMASFCSNSPPNLILGNGDKVEDPYAPAEGWNKSRMWSQYGDNHTGACIVFSKNTMEDIICKECGSAGTYKCDNIFYLQKYGIPPASLTLNGNRLIKEGMEQYLTSFVLSNLDNICFVKHIDYRDEAEYRIVIHDPRYKLETINIRTALKGVIWGDRISQVEDLKSLHEECDRLAIGCLYLKWDRGRPYPVLCTKP